MGFLSPPADRVGVNGSVWGWTLIGLHLLTLGLALYGVNPWRSYSFCPNVTISIEASFDAWSFSWLEIGEGRGKGFGAGWQISLLLLMLLFSVAHTEGAPLVSGFSHSHEFIHILGRPGGGRQTGIGVFLWMNAASSIPQSFCGPPIDASVQVEGTLLWRCKGRTAL